MATAERLEGRAAPSTAARSTTGPAGPAAARWHGAGSLKARMALVLGVVLLLPTLYAAAQTWIAWRDDGLRRVELVRGTAQLISAYQSDLVERSWTLLRELGQQPAVQAAEPRCGALLADTLRQNPIYGSVVRVDRSGTVACGSQPELEGLEFADRAWFREAAGGGPVASEVLESRDGTSGRTVVVAHPILAADGTVQGAVAASLLLARFTAVTKSVPLPQGAVAYVVDRNGEPLQFDAGGLPLSAPPAEQNRRLREAGGQPVAIDSGPGRGWLYLASPIARGQLSVVVGLPVEPWAWLRQDLILGLLVPTLMLALAVLAIWIATDYLVNRHIVALARVADEYGQGRLSLEPPTRDAPDEIVALTRALATTALKIQARETELEASLAQKDMLLKEIHHRVKNNLQIVTSLLNLRAQRLVSPIARAALDEAQTRIRALALVHRHLYEQTEVKSVDLHAFLGELCALLEDTSIPDGARGVEVEVEVAPVTVTIDQAIPIALLVTEALSNAFKHAFPAGRPGSTGRVRVRLASDGSGAVLEIADDGIGYAAPAGSGRDGGDAGGLGLTLIRMLARQIGGEVTIVTGTTGTRLTLPFKADAPPGPHEAESPPGPAGTGEGTSPLAGRSTA